LVSLQTVKSVEQARVSGGSPAQVDVPAGRHLPAASFGVEPVVPALDVIVGVHGLVVDVP